MCHIESLTAEQREVYDGLSRGLRVFIDNTLEREVVNSNTTKTRAVFERILKAEGIAPTASSPDAIDLAMREYTRGKSSALSA